jgi:hypothetical protein
MSEKHNQADHWTGLRHAGAALPDVELEDGTALEIKFGPGLAEFIPETNLTAPRVLAAARDAGRT